MRFDNSRLGKFIIDNVIDSAYCIASRTGRENFWKEKKSSFDVLKPTIRYWYADPIPFQINNKLYIFMEQYDRLKQIGYIGLAEFRRNGRLTRPKIIIKEKTHLSFPMLMQYKQEYYMFPESSSTGTIEIYKMEHSPYYWRHYYSIKIDEKIVDIAWRMENDDILLLGGIEEDKNPLLIRRQLIRLRNLDNIKELKWDILYTDKRGSLAVRNGGNFIGDYRIIQESTEADYGIYITLYKVDEMNCEGIRERLISRKSVDDIEVQLSKFLYRKIGTHTYGKCNNCLEVIDLSVTKLSIWPLFRKIRGIQK